MLTAVLAVASRADDVIVPGTANPWLAGATNGTIASGGDVAPDESPVLFTGFTAGSVLQFAATGSAGYEAGAESGPDGVTGYYVTDPAKNGIGEQERAQANELLAVFLNDSVPDSNATTPPALDFGPGSLQDYAQLQPLLNQPFAIGSGTNADGVQRSITAPAGATRLFLGICDGSGWYNNTGSFTVSISSGPTPPGDLSLRSLGSGALQLAWTAPKAGSYKVQSSTNLVNWTDYLAVTNAPSGPVTNTVYFIPGSSAGFFRIEYLP